MPELVRAASGLLGEMYDEREGKFCYTLKRGPEGAYRDFAHPKSIRYSINTLLGLVVADERDELGWDLPAVFDHFLGQHLSEVTSPADQGMLLEALVRCGHDASGTVLETVLGVIKDGRHLGRLQAHDVAWMLSGIARHAHETGSDRSRSAAEWLFRVMDREFLNRDTVLPRFSREPWRRPFITFGGLTYFLRALADYAELFDDTYAGVILDEAVQQAILLQGPQGEWPWLWNADQKRIADWYPVYTTHQASMAMLFLLPALDRGVPGVEGAIRKSYRWMFGENQLGTRLLVTDPFQTYRSIRRPGERKRGVAFVQGLRHAALRSQARLLPPVELEVNRECRSYEMGWILYAWSGRAGFEEYTELELA